MTRRPRDGRRLVHHLDGHDPFPPRAKRSLHQVVLDEILEERVVSGRGRRVPRGVKRKMSRYKLRPRGPQPTIRVDFAAPIQILK